ncbi:MAG TPA: hypothetical protein VGO47_08650, partial [Chlamydiales bacterium]|nr:hypothetical protein [Chlamydiales bacterium]
MSQWPFANNFGSSIPLGWTPDPRDPETSFDESQVGGPPKSSGRHAPTYCHTIFPQTTDVSFPPVEHNAWLRTLDTAQTELSQCQYSNSIGPTGSLEGTKNTAAHWQFAFTPLGLEDLLPTFFGPTEASHTLPERSSSRPQTYHPATSPTETPDCDVVLTPSPNGDFYCGPAKSRTWKYSEIPDFTPVGSEHVIASSSLAVSQLQPREVEFQANAYVMQHPIQQREDRAAHHVSSISSAHEAIPKVAYPANGITIDTVPQQEELMPQQILRPYIDPLTSRVTCPYVDPI